MTPETPERAVDPAAEATVRVLLATAGVPATEEEITAYAAGYPSLRAMADLLHVVPAARYELPGLHFDPTPGFVAWS